VVLTAGAGQLQVRQNPCSIVAATRDTMGAKLDRVQMIKGWHDSAGNLHEKVYDIVRLEAETREPDASGQIPPVGGLPPDVSEGASWTLRFQLQLLFPR